MRRRLLSSFALLAGLFGACRFDASVPEEARIACTSSAACPQGFDCQVGHCVRAAAVDRTRPDVVAGTVSLTLDALPGEPALDALAAQRTAHLRFTVTEALARLPALHAPSPLACTLVEATELTFAFSCALEANAPALEAQLDGFSVQLEDLAGNQATVALDVAVLVDTIPPAAPEVDAPGAVVLRRAPYGDVDGGPPSFTLLGGPGAVVGAKTVQVFAEGHEVGEGPVDADGGFRVELLRVVTPVVSVRARDGAGNVSQEPRVRDGEWVLTPGGRVPGQAVPNPHPLATWGALGPAVPMGAKLEVGDRDGLARVDGAGVRVEGHAAWHLMATLGSVSSDNPSLMVADQARGRIIQFNNYEQGVLEWAGAGWILRVSSDPEGDGDPEPPFQRTAGAWDPTTGLSLMFANPQADGPELWGWSGASWRRLADGPSLRREPMFVQDGVGRRVLMFGGFDPDGGAVLGDLWEYRAARWSPLDAGVLPAARTGAAAAWDPRHGVVWMFSGAGADGGLLPDFWSWDGRAFSRVSAMGTGPGARRSAQLTCEPAGTCWMFGGVAADGGGLPELWSWDGARWTLRSGGGGPEGNGNNGLLHLPSLGRTVVFPGDPSSNNPYKSTWQWDGATWSRFPLQNSYDFAPTQGLSMGCAWPDGPCLATDDATSSWLDEAGWHAVGGSTMEPADLVTIAHDPRTNQFVRTAFSRAVGNPIMRQTADLPSGGWALPVTDSVAPELDYIKSAGGNDGVYAGLYSGELYHLRDAGYVRVLDAGSVITTNLCAAHMPDGGVLMAGHAAAEVGRTGVRPLPPPPVRLTQAAYEPGTGRLFGVMGWLTPLYTTFTDGGWERVGITDYDGVGVPLNLELGTLRGHIIGWEAAHRMWVLEWAEAHPGAVWSVLWADAQIPDEAVLTGVTAQASAGATSQVDGGAAAGARVGLFIGGRWVTGAGNSAATSAPATAALDVVDPLTLRELREEGPQLQVEVVPVGVNGGGTASLELDAVELHVTYRLP